MRAGNLTIVKYNETDYAIAKDHSNPQAHFRVENSSLYILDTGPRLQFAEFRGNQIYIKVRQTRLLEGNHLLFEFLHQGTQLVRDPANLP